MSSHRGIVIHITSGDNSDWQMALRNLSNLYQDESVSTAPGRMKVVVNGDAVRFLLATSPEAPQITKITEAGVQVGACSKSLDRLGFSPNQLAEGVTTIPSGVAEVVRVQQHDATYLKLP